MDPPIYPQVARNAENDQQVQARKEEIIVEQVGKAAKGRVHEPAGCDEDQPAMQPSVVTPKPANGGQGKTGQREEAGDSVVLSCRLLWWQVYFRTPTPRTTFEYMTMMEKTIEHGGNGGAISQ